MKDEEPLVPTDRDVVLAMWMLAAGALGVVAFVLFLYFLILSFL